MAKSKKREKINNEVEMPETFRAKVSSEDMDYLHNVIEAGKNGELNEFYNLPVKEKEEWVRKLFIKKLISLMNISPNAIEIRYNSAGEVSITKTVNVKMEGSRITGNEQKLVAGKKVSLPVLKEYSKTIPVCVTLAKFSKITFENNELTFIPRLLTPFLNEEKVKSLIPSFELYDFEGEVNYIIPKKEIIQIEPVEWNRKLLEAQEEMAISSKKKKLLSEFFNLLYSAKLTEMKGNEAVHFSTIYENAVKYYPLFAKASLAMQVKVLDEAWLEALKNPSRDIYFLAKKVYMEFESRNLHKNVIMLDPLNKKEKMYSLVKEYRRNRGVDGKVFEENAVIWIEYKYQINEKDSIRAGYKPSDLWRILHGRVESDFEVA